MINDDMRRKIYLAGPMRGLPDNNYPAFDEAAAELRAQGHTVVNPTELFGGNLNLSRAEYMRGGLKALLDCTTIAVLPGWASSTGTVVEMTVARSIDLEIREFAPGVGLRDLFAD